jgi:hypothetical protein
MADISKCSNSKCRLRAGCYRATAPDGVWQAYQMFYPEKSGACDWFMPTEMCGCEYCKGDCDYWKGRLEEHDGD